MVIVPLIIGLLLLVLGYLIKYKKWSWMIAGYNTSSKEEKEKYDELALCSFIGSFLFLLACILFVGALGSYLGAYWLISFSWFLFTVIIIMGVVYMNTGNRFKK